MLPRKPKKEAKIGLRTWPTLTDQEDRPVTAKPHKKGKQIDKYINGLNQMAKL
jgi:hypothetical protein